MKKAKTMRVKQQRGFTLIELIVTMSIIAIVAAIALPNMSIYTKNNRITSTTGEILRSIQNARSEATRHIAPVVICASPNPDGANPICKATASDNLKGWIVFVDANSDWKRNVADPNETLLESHTLNTDQLTLGMNGSFRISFGQDGFPRRDGAAFPEQNTTALVVVDDRGNVDSSGYQSGGRSVGRGIVVATTGRARSTYDITEINGLCTKAGVSKCMP